MKKRSRGAKAVAERWLGSVSSGTLREEDLAEAFLDCLEDIAPRRARELRKDKELCSEDLFNALDEHSPPFFRFGAHAGDGADFGFWFSSEAFETACFDGEIVKIGDPNEIEAAMREHPEAFYIANVNDHGNVTLFSVRRWVDSHSRSYAQARAEWAIV